MAEIINVLVDGGSANAGPPLGPALGPLGANIMNIVKEINEHTKHFKGMKVPVKLTINPKTKDFTVEVGTPPTSALIMKELGLKKASSSNRKEKAGDLTIDQAKKIAEMKAGNTLGNDLSAKVKEILGTCVSMGITVDGKEPQEVQRLINSGGIKI